MEMKMIIMSYSHGVTKGGKTRFTEDEINHVLIWIPQVACHGLSHMKLGQDHW